MFSPFSKQQAGAGHFATCKVQYLDVDSFAVGTTDDLAGRQFPPEQPSRLSVIKPREQPKKYGSGTTAPTQSRRRHGVSVPPVSTAKRSPGPSAPLPGSKLLKAWRAARK